MPIESGAPAPRAATRLALLTMVLGAILLVWPFLAIILPFPTPPGLATSLLGLGLVVGGFSLHRRGQPAAPTAIEAPRRRKLGLATAAIGVLLLALHFFALPDVTGFEVECSPDATGERLGHGAWIVVRDPQLGQGVISYDALNDTTLIVPGCGHGDARIALRVVGDHRDFGAGEGIDRLVLVPHGVTGAWEGNVSRGANASSWEPGSSLRILAGSFTTSTLAGHIASYVLGLAFLFGAAGLSRPGLSVIRGAIPAIGALAGSCLVLWLLDGGAIFIALLFGLPFVVLPGFVVGLSGALATWRKPRSWVIFLALAALAVAYVATFFAFADLFPAYPEA